MLRVIFAILIITIGVGLSWIYFFPLTSDDSLLIKCADQKYDEIYGIDLSTIMSVYNEDLDKRFEFSEEYVTLYQLCEIQLNNSPKTFKQLYKN